MTGLSQSEQSRGELFRPNKRSFTALHHLDIVLQAIARSTFYQINALSDIC